MKAIVEYLNNQKKEINLYNKFELSEIIKNYSNSSLEQIKLLDKFESLTINNNTYYVNKLNFKLKYIKESKFNLKFLVQNLCINIFFPFFTLIFSICHLESNKMIDKLPAIYLSTFMINLCFGTFTFFVNHDLAIKLYFLGIFSFSLASYLPYDTIKNYSVSDYIIDRPKIKNITIFDADKYLSNAINSLSSVNNNNNLDFKKEINFSFNSLENLK